jgi:MoCo/4Fe-4S cofactor protein with predicted Tat translocation signal
VHEMSLLNKMDKKYWKSLEELKSSPEKDYLEDYQNIDRNEMFDLVKGDNANVSATRRDFLKLCGFSIATTALVAGCERPVQKAIPYLFKPEEVIPGESNYYASTFFDGDDYGSIVVKVRDGRPIKIEGNDLSDISAGSATARIQASVLELYDTARYRSPLENKSPISWEDADEKIRAGLLASRGMDGNIVLLTGTVISPSTREIINDFINVTTGSRWVQYDPLSFSGLLEANRLSFGTRVLPSLHFERAEVIVSFGADFLGTWLLPVSFARQYASGRRVTETNAEMSRHIHFESGLSITGASADERIQIKPSEVNPALRYLLQRVKGNNPPALPGYDGILDTVAALLLENSGRSLVVCGSNETGDQVLVNAINYALGSYGNTLDLSNPVNLRQGDDAAILSLVDEMEKGDVSALLIYNVNPVFDHPLGERFAAGMEKVSLKVSFAGAPDETAELCDFICPDHHYLESWGDAEPVSRQYSLQQPVIRPLGNTRQMQDSLMVWSGREERYSEILKQFWNTNILLASGTSEPGLWLETLQKGIWAGPPSTQQQPQFNTEYSDGIPGRTDTGAPPGSILELEITQSVALGSGKHANNPWLQELPDPISKVCWDNFMAVSVADAAANFLETGDVVLINNTFEIPVLVQPGQAPGTVSIAMGYGRSVGGKVAEGTGVNVLPQAGYINGAISFRSFISSLENTGAKHKIALSQTHHSMEGRAIVRETSLEQYRTNPSAGNEMREDILNHMYTLYEEVVFDGLHWGMAIDLNACNGCSACVIACQAENNIPVIGKEEVYRRRIMHWIRTDRYYSGSSDNPGVHFMPVLCQHCDNAPCENVCPVAATNHSDEGLNQMAYVRCIGTKYCINNCPYKVRRFNWFNYTRSDKFNNYMNDDVGRMVLNPDVTVRERGIVEKCTFCVQRIQEAKIRAKNENRVLREDEIMPACAQTCPSNAIVFGNLADKNSRIYELFRDKRNYHLLEELHTLPSIGYLTRVKNKQS